MFDRMGTHEYAAVIAEVEYLEAENAKLKAFHDAVGKADHECDADADGRFKDFYIAVMLACKEVE